MTTLTRQHFRALAAALSESRASVALPPLTTGTPGVAYAAGMTAQYTLCCAAVALVLVRTNSRFDVDLFMAACGLAKQP